MSADLIAKVYSVGVLVVGLSHLMRPRLWSSFFAELGQSRHAAFTVGIFTLPAGLLIVVGHNVWVPGPPLLVTLAGWGMALKSASYLLFPRTADRFLAKSAAAPRGFVVIGAVMTAMGILLVLDSFILPLTL